MEKLIRVEKLEKSFFDGASELKVLRGVDLEVNKAEILAIMGASGAGKSTLLHLIGTLDRPTSGNIYYEDEDITTYSERELTQFRNTSVGFVFQFHQLLPEFNALENVIMGKLISSRKSGYTGGQKLNRNEMNDRAENLLGSVGLSERLTHFPSQLSGGERQRVAIARSLMNQPKVILADEPTGNIDDITSEVVFDVLLQVNEELNQTIIIVTHDSRLSDQTSRTVNLVEGKIIF